ncbi:hypothetical protein RB653_001780 [Dictyostelium firmibasis]|uniref:Uncharacterized protein n=1 Tax=Dictyostelium firmibasis TaxID=79012 RepID=A0AAN7U7V2_9MYCE
MQNLLERIKNRIFNQICELKRR